MTVGIVGLGLIGGSLAKAFKKYTSHRILGYDRVDSVVSYAKLSGTIDGALTDSHIPECDYIFIAVYPRDTVEYVNSKAPIISENTVVIDCGGIKRYICEECFKTAREYNFTFIGGHPMAGKHFSSIKYADADLYRNASMILTPENTDDVSLMDKVSTLIKSVGFGSVTVTNPEKHDEVIAFTSQLAHVVSNAYVKSPNAKVHKGFSAGSYKDLTRVAQLNENMWAELFLENKENLIFEIDNIVNCLNEYKAALEKGDEKTLKLLLKAGSDRKKSIDGSAR